MILCPQSSSVDAPLELDPSATVFHYAFTLYVQLKSDEAWSQLTIRFEGMKAYRQEDDTVRLFRPDKNMARMNKVSPVDRAA